MKKIKKEMMTLHYVYKITYINHKKHSDRIK